MAKKGFSLLPSCNANCALRVTKIVCFAQRKLCASPNALHSTEIVCFTLPSTEIVCFAQLAWLNGNCVLRLTHSALRSTFNANRFGYLQWPRRTIPSFHSSRTPILLFCYFHPTILLFCYFHPSIPLFCYPSMLPSFHFSHMLLIAHAHIY